MVTTRVVAIFVCFINTIADFPIFNLTLVMCVIRVGIRQNMVTTRVVAIFCLLHSTRETIVNVVLFMMINMVTTRVVAMFQGCRTSYLFANFAWTVMHIRQLSVVLYPMIICEHADQFTAASSGVLACRRFIVTTLIPLLHVCSCSCIW
jgi:hypothetical protein